MRCLCEIRWLFSPILLLAGFGCSTSTAFAADGEKAGLDFFERKIRPVLVEHCYACHSAQSKSVKGGLRLDTRAGMHKGGATGPAVVPGKIVDSLIVSALRQDMFAMPPKGKLPEAIIADFEQWIVMGAPDPRSDPVSATTSSKSAIDIAEGRQFWAFQPITQSDPPKVSDHSKVDNWIDNYVLDRLEKSGLQSAPEAEPATLLRRLSIDLTGLPPTAQELRDFLTDVDPVAGALARLEAPVKPAAKGVIRSNSQSATGIPQSSILHMVERLLASPRFGERWGRHWLDLARYADSNGRDENLTYHHAWRYRNYVIDSFNTDVPFDRFVTEQIAGDLLPYRNQAERDRQLIAASFLLVGPKVLANRDKPLLRMDVADEQIDTCGRVFLGMTLGCARCHDHKFDPIPTTDYYALAGIFASTHTIDGIKKNNVAVSGWNERGLGVDGDKRLAAYRAYEKSLKPVVDDIKKIQDQLKTAKGKTADELKAKLASAQAKEKQLKATAPPIPEIAMAPRDEEKIVDSRVHLRGDLNQLGDRIPRGFMTVAFVGDRPKMPADQSGRLQLARWIVDSTNPLTARVVVNRIWSHLLGEGLVRTRDNFGVQGERPTHPELLDALARRFVADGWSFKKLIREIVLSRTYRQAVWNDSRSRSIDPENRLLWRANRRRVEAEVLRDGMMAVSGQLDFTKGGCPVPSLGEVAVENDSKSSFLQTDEIRLRSVYLPVIRNELPAVFEVFDFADHDVATGRRDNTTVPTQALFMLNGPLVAKQAQATAKRLLQLSNYDCVRIDDLYIRCFTRRPTESEMKAALAFVGNFKAGKPEGQVAAWTALCQAVFASTEFRFIE